MMENPSLGVRQSMDHQEKDEQREYPVAYAPIPKGVIKEEETSGDNNTEQQIMYPVAYPSLPRGLVKEEEPFGDAQEECTGQAQQLMASSPTSNRTMNKELERSMEEHNIFNLDEGQQVSLEPLIAYLPLPRGAIKEEPLEEKGDEQLQQVIIAYPPIARGRVKEELQSNVHEDERDVDEHQLDLEALIACPPLPRVVIKEEPVEEEECEQPAKQLISYPPISREKVKEEAVDTRDDFNLGEHQIYKLIPQEGGNQNLVEESTPGTQLLRRKSQKKKKITIASTAVISPSSGSGDQSAKLMPTTNSRTRRSLHKLKRGSTSILSAEGDGEKDDRCTADREIGAQRPKSKRRKVTASTTDTPSSTGSAGDQSAKKMSIISSRTRPFSMSQLKRSKAPMTRDADEKNNDHITAESDDFGGHKSDKMAHTISSQTRSHHSKPDSASMVRDDIEKTSKKRKVNEDKGTKEKQQQGTKNDKPTETSENSSSSDENFERSSDSHNKYRCEKCGRGFQKKCSLHLHLLKTHTETGHETLPLNRFKCDQCMKTYKNKNSLVQHLLNECRVDPAFCCSQCDYKATKKSNLRKHLISIHKVDSSQLDKVSAAVTLSVRPVLPYKCEKCEKTFKSKDALYFHKQRVCGVAPSFFCVKCDYRTARKFDLRKHLMNVHEVEPSQLANYGAGKVVRPQLPFKCDKCERSYKHKHHLKDHMDFECGKIPSFPCNQCGYRASRNSNLKKHINAVHGSSSSSLQA